MAPPGATTTTRTLRRLALERQGLLKTEPFGRGRGGIRRAIEQLGYVQIDTISVVSRAHDHVLEARVPGYRPELLDAALRRGEVFEYWAHAAAYLPMRDYRFSLPRMHAMRAGEDRWVRSRDTRLMRRVLDRIRAEGPLQTRDFEAPKNRGNTGWWDWKPAKQALEQLFMQGDLMAVGRRGFQKVYDLTERALPAHVNTCTPTVEELAAHLIERQVAAMGCASTRVCTYQRPIPGLRPAVDAALERAVRRGELVRLTVGNGNARQEAVFAEPDALQRRAAPAPARARVLSPFDNLVIHRHRGQTLFDFDYQLECYVPAAKRRFGYFCLPILYRDRLVGRTDCKAHRSSGRFEIKGLFIEHPQIVEDDGERAYRAIAAALTHLARANDCDHLDLGSVQPARASGPLRRACRDSNEETT
ncbi:MAG: winged helix-turn-helix domain-containing protein [Gammaproteobacteria bacterium]|jgi:uncharacterized protein YcaQ|nr:winged helix-turn-helix domain-containing protein [Gammaproteobacteria bacterium]